MIDRIHLDTKLDKCLAALKKGSRRACLAADRVETIIAELKAGQTPPQELCAYTRRGEARIKGCRKFNLGAGYRLVTLKQDNDLYLLYVGTHDACARWIENNREQLLLDVIEDRCRTLKRRPPAESGSGQQPAPPPECSADDDWLPPIDDKDLRMIFSGLIEGR